MDLGPIRVETLEVENGDVAEHEILLSPMPSLAPATPLTLAELPIRRVHQLLSLVLANAFLECRSGYRVTEIP